MLTQPELASAIKAVPAGTEAEIVVGGANGLKLRVTKNGAATWVMRYRVPSGQRRVRLGHYPTMGLAKARSEARKVLGRIEDGEDPSADLAAQRIPGETLADVIKKYIEEHEPGWKRGTARTYQSAIGTFTAWAESVKVKLATDLDASALASYRAHAVALRRRMKKKGGGRRDVISTAQPRSAAAVNCDLRAVKTMLQALRVAGRLPSITSSDAIRDNLRAVPATVAKARPLKPQQIRDLLDAAARHDAATHKITRAEHRGERTIGTTPKHEPIRPLVLVMLLSGMRLGEALALEWTDIDLDEKEIRVRSQKTGHERIVDLSISPMLVEALATLRPDAAAGRVFPRHTEASVSEARRRLIEDYNSPALTWSVHSSRPGETAPPTLRSTCGCYLANAPGIFAAASAFRSAQQLGHSIAVAERHYLGTLRSIPKSAKTIEAAMQITDEVRAGKVVKLPKRQRR